MNQTLFRPSVKAFLHHSLKRRLAPPNTPNGVRFILHSDSGSRANFRNMMHFNNNNNNNNVACFPHVGTVETQKPRNTHATVEVRVFIARCWVTPRSLLDNSHLNN
jgi:hypothetical protein